MARKKRSSWERRRRRRERGPAPGSRELLKVTAQLAALRSDEEIDAFYRQHPDLQATQQDWFFCLHAAARAEQLPDIKGFCQDAWHTMWKFRLSDNRFRYLAHDKACLPQRLEAYERVLSEQRLDPAMSTRSFLLGAFMAAKEVIRNSMVQGEARLEEIDGVTVARVRSETGDWLDVPVVHKRLPTAVTAAIELLGTLVEKRILLEALERGYVPGPRGQFVQPAAPTVQPVLNQQLNIGMQTNAAGMIPGSQIPKATSMTSGPAVDPDDYEFHPEEVRALIAQENRPWRPTPPYSMSYEDHLARMRKYDEGGPLPYPQSDEIVGEAKTAHEMAAEAKRKEMSRGVLLDPAAVVDAEAAEARLPAWRRETRAVGATPQASTTPEGTREGSR